MVEVDVLIEAEGEPSRCERVRVEGALTVGRTATNALCLEGDLVSRTHALIDLGTSALRIEDRSSNGTLAGDLLLRHRTVEVPYGTPIVVGNYTLHVSPARHTASTPPRPTAIPGSGPVLRAPAPPTFGPAPTPATIGFGAPPLARPSRPPPIAARAGTLSPPALKPEGVARPTVAPPPLDASPVESEVQLRRDIHAKLLESLDLAKLDAGKLDDPSMRPRVLIALRRIVKQLDARIAPAVDRAGLADELADEVLGLGPLERFLADPTISEIMVVDPSTIFVEQGGKLVRADARFTDDERVRAVIERIVTPLGRRIDESSPIVDARLEDGSRINAVIRPIARSGSTITIRKLAKMPLTLDKLIDLGALTAQMARFLTRSVICKKNVVISGGAGSGKTTLLNVLAGAIPDDERIVTIEDAAELQLAQPHVVSLETRPADMDGRGEYTLRDLVRNARCMRPDRIVVGECRGGEALDVLQAMSTGHDGSLATTHASSPEEAIARIETLALMGGVALPSRAIREQIAASVHLVVQQSRFPDGSRRTTAVSEVAGIGDEGRIEVRPIFELVRTGIGPGGRVLGEHRATGYLPSFLDAFIAAGLVRRGEPYL